MEYIWRIFIGTTPEGNIIFPGYARGSEKVSKIRTASDHLSRKDFTWFRRGRGGTIALLPNTGITSFVKSFVYEQSISPNHNYIFLLRDKEPVQ